MKAVLFCQNQYAFGILNPIKEELISEGDSYLWYLPQELLNKFPFTSDPFTTSLKEVVAFGPDAHFVPGNEIPHYLRGIKTQVFHGMAGEKKGHFRIRDYFDLYLTPGPYFTSNFERLKKNHSNFEVVETGWSKLDSYAKERHLYDNEKSHLLNSTGAKNLILYAPTFSPALTSAPYLLAEVEKLAKNPDYFILIKFHDLMNPILIQQYEQLSENYNNIKIEKAHNIIKYLLMADILVSDTSSVIYEFILLDKPVLTFKNISDEIHWDNQLKYEDLSDHIKTNLNEDPYRKKRQYILNEFHPYSDGHSAKRMVSAVKNYHDKFGIPNYRKVSFLRKLKIYKLFGRVK